MTRLIHDPTLTFSTLLDQQQRLLPSQHSNRPIQKLHRDENEPTPSTETLLDILYSYIDHHLTTTNNDADRPCGVNCFGCSLRVDGRESVFNVCYFFHRGVMAAVDLDFESQYVATAHVGRSSRDVELDIIPRTLHAVSTYAQAPSESFTLTCSVTFSTTSYCLVVLLPGRVRLAP